MSDNDIEAAARAAFDSLDAPPAGADQGAAGTAGPSAADQASADDAGGGEAGGEGRVRDAHGRFAPKLDNVQEVDNPADAPNGAEPPDETIRPPKSWKAAAKAAFASLPPEIRAEVQRREGEIDAGQAQWSQKATEYNRFDELFQPIDQRLTLAGVDRTGYIKALITADNMLRSNPQQALQLLSQQYGFQLPQAQQPQSFAQPAPQAPQQQIDPTVQQLQQQFAQLAGHIQSQQEAQEQAERDQAMAQIKAFSDDPKNTFFENVKDTMGQLMRIDPKLTLQQAYDKACRMDDEVWTAMQAKPLPKAQPGRPKDIQATGAMQQGVPARAPSNGSRASLEAAVRAAYEQSESRVR